MSGLQVTRGAKPADTEPSPFRTWLASRFERERRGVWILLVLILTYMAWANPRFYGRGNIAAVLNDAAILGIGAAGMTILIIAGAFDLSVTAIMGLAPLVALLYFGDLPGPVGGIHRKRGKDLDLGPEFLVFGPLPTQFRPFARFEVTDGSRGDELVARVVAHLDHGEASVIVGLPDHVDDLDRAVERGFAFEQVSRA